MARKECKVQSAHSQSSITKGGEWVCWRVLLGNGKLVGQAKSINIYLNKMKWNNPSSLPWVVEVNIWTPSVYPISVYKKKNHKGWSGNFTILIQRGQIYGVGPLTRLTSWDLETQPWLSKAETEPRERENTSYCLETESIHIHKVQVHYILKLVCFVFFFFQ